MDLITMPVCQKMWQTLPFLMLFLNDVDKYVLEECYKFEYNGNGEHEKRNP